MAKAAAQQSTRGLRLLKIPITAPSNIANWPGGKYKFILLIRCLYFHTGINVKYLCSSLLFPLPLSLSVLISFFL
jgi:hypothetical protein